MSKLRLAIIYEKKLNMFRLIRTFYPFILIILPISSSFLFQPKVTALITFLTSIIFFFAIFQKPLLRPYYFILNPILLGTRTYDTSDFYFYELSLTILLIIIIFEKLKFKRKFKINNTLITISIIFIFQIFVSFINSIFSINIFSYKELINYLFVLVYGLTFYHFCFASKDIIKQIPYAFGLAGPLTGLISLGYRIQGLSMLDISLGTEKDYFKFAKMGIFHYASLLRFSYTNIHLILLISIFAWIFILTKNSMLNSYNNNTMSCLWYTIFFKLIFMSNYIITSLFHFR